MASGQPYRDQGPGADELHITAEALPCQKALHVHVQLVPQRNEGLVLGLQPGRSGSQSRVFEALPTTHPFQSRPHRPPTW